MSLYFGAIIPVVAAPKPDQSVVHPKTSRWLADKIATEIDIAREIVERGDSFGPGGTEFQAYQDLQKFDPEFRAEDGVTLAYTLKDGLAPGFHGEGRNEFEVREQDAIEDVFLLTGAEKKAVDQSGEEAFLKVFNEEKREILGGMKQNGQMFLYFQEKFRQAVLEAQDKMLRQLKQQSGTRITEKAIISSDYPHRLMKENETV